MSLLARIIAVPLTVVALVSAAAPAWADTTRDQQWWLSTMELPVVHAMTRGAGVTVAIVDSGVDATHPDLAGAISGSSDPAATRDVDGRGTALAALVAGRGHGPGNADGILGVAPAAMILPIVFATGPAEAGSPDALAAGIDEAIERGAQVICIGRGVAPSPRLAQAVLNAQSRDVVVVAADGNRVDQVFPPWPASSPGVLTPIVLNRAGVVVVPPASRLSTGVGVPGTDLVTATLGGRYREDGSAAGVLCGAVALVRSAAPQLKAEAVVDLLRSTAADRGPTGPDVQYGAGVLDLTKALSAVPRPAPSPSSAAPTAAPSPSVSASTIESDFTTLVGSGDWRRWLIVLLPVFFLIGLGTFALRRR
ncbi:subtilisin family serine protease [Allocatelliglobosispora scoriae]|uniref:Subtilisin family serine protease n=1 Tax=Allocatelliglobosispora scoriae TaxID=643052 RepID=A0A841BXN5_9ACTN|nr:S8 family serine peptidase [Allocatelliglobosispora scoriae]MBB5871693.1 subtilisin family serine protease [Allocatelliglobosispora scoriae]